MAQVQLFRKDGTYTDKDGKERNSVQFYLQCGSSLVPIECTYFKKKDENGEVLKDFQYSARREVMKSYADVLPAKK